MVKFVNNKTTIRYLCTLNMKSIILQAALSLVLISCSANAGKKSNANIETKTNMNPVNFHDLSIMNIDGKVKLNMSDYKGKKILCVNVASKCGYTSQYKDLQQLHETLSDKVVIIGFPCNQFGGQEPGTPEEITTFCEKNYKVSFTLTEKIDVKGSEQHPIYKWLTSKELNGKDNYSVKWNFNKFLIDENGALMAYYGSGTNPMSEEIVELIKK